MKQITLFTLLVLLLAAGCGDDDDSSFNRIALIGRDAGWKLGEIASDFDATVNTAIDGLTEDQIAADPRSRDDLRQQYSSIIRTATIVDDCDRDDILFFLSNGLLRIIPGDETCGADGDPNPLARFNDRTYSVDINATEMTVRANTGELIGFYTIDEVNDGTLSFETETIVADSIFTNLTYSIRYELIPD